MNDSIISRNKFWNDHSVNGFLYGSNMFKGLQSIYSGVSDDQFIMYLKNIYNYSGNPK
jgi:hypothetical protein